MQPDFGPAAARLKATIAESQDVLIAAHVSPDGDTIGSALALMLGIRALGKRVRVVCSDPVPRNLRFLPEWQAIECGEVAVEPVDLAIIVDLNVPRRLGRVQSAVRAAKAIAIIDHHELPEDVQEDAILIDSSEHAATALIIHQILPDLGIEMTRDIAQCLLTGIATDTGSFRFQNTSADCLHAAADLIGHGADLNVINEEVWEKKPVSAIRLLARALSSLELRADGRLAFGRLTAEDFQMADADDEDSDGIVNEIGRVDTARVFALFREFRPGKVRVSVRSRGAVDIAEVCRRFGGGGHKNAAGCTYDGGLDDAIAVIVPHLEQAAREG